MTDTATDTVKQSYRPGVLHRIDPLHDPAPLVFDIPRSGRASAICESRSVARPVSHDAGQPRSDFDIGDGHGMTCDRAFVDTVMQFLAAFGYDVTFNKHFAGAESIHKHSDPGNGP